ncbi:MAG: tetratricopeptide repeat protein [Parasulfuritortus sp.]|jgi:tetratricopeptide (TPR) repeat protein|nr:tetratricopeptide repeat protein [Parasulfuritortus sp.]
MATSNSVSTIFTNYVPAANAYGSSNNSNYVGSYNSNYDMATSLFQPSSSQSAQLDSYAQNALAKALDLYTNKKYTQAIAVFKQAIGYSPSSSTAINAYNYMAQSYLQLGDNNSAINTYKKSLVADPSQDATHTSLAKIYYSQGNYSSAVNEFAKAAKLNPSSGNIYSLGQGYMADGQYNNAMKEFAQVRRMAPNQSYGDFGMGQVYAKQGQYSDAIASFQKAIKINPKDWNAYSEMGYALADSGQLAQAQQVVSTLQPNNANLSSQLSTYIYGKTKPQMTSKAYSMFGSPLLTVMGPGTKVADLGNYNMVNPNAQQTFSVAFQFSKPMDVASVQNVQNWTISRSSGTSLSQDYNYGMPIQPTEVSLPYNPTSVVYDPSSFTATVLFSINQNATADATIDPSHIQFGFNGKDITGMTMDPKANEYTGFSGFA